MMHLVYNIQLNLIVEIQINANDFTGYSDKQIGKVMNHYET